jgi:hypothetical protein
MPAARRRVCLPGAILPAASPFVNPDSAHHGPRREPLDAADVPRPSTCRAAAPGPMPVARSATRPSTAGTVASGAGIKPGEAFHREALGEGEGEARHT